MTKEDIMECHSCVGLIIAFTNWFEALCPTFLSKITKLNPKTCEAMLAGESLQVKMKIIDASFQSLTLPKDAVRYFNEQVKVIQLMSEWRNDLVHSSYLFGESDLTFTLSKQQRKQYGKLPKVKTKVLSKRDLFNHINVMLAVYFQFGEFIVGYFEES